MPTDAVVKIASAEIAQQRQYTPEHWDRLYWRCVSAARRAPHTARWVKIAWVLVMERRTGKNCFFMPHGPR
jgi:hypothetical protein